MSDEFELDHWKSRATIAEAERDSARSVLAYLRSFHRDPSLENGARLLARRKEHDVTWWNVEHAMDAVVEAIAGAEDDRPSAAVPQPGVSGSNEADSALIAKAVDVSMRIVDKWLTDENGAMRSASAASDGLDVTLPLQSLYNLAGLCLYLAMEPSVGEKK
jgi:hypothetical protein